MLAIAALLPTIVTPTTTTIVIATESCPTRECPVADDIGMTALISMLSELIPTILRHVLHQCDDMVVYQKASHDGGH